MGGNLVERQSINCAQCRCMCAIPKWMYSTVSENVSSFKSMINKEDIIANLREVYDPEISINVFDLGLIYGIDIDPRCIQHKEDRIEIIIGDQNDDNFLSSLASKFDKSIDILLDDGSHITKHQIKTYDTLYKCVKKTGLFIIEYDKGRIC